MLAQLADSPTAPRRLVRELHEFITAQELTAAATARATPGAADVVRWCRERGMRLAISSNSAGDAIKQCLERPELGLDPGWFDCISGRVGDAVRMMPHPDCRLRALDFLRVGPESCLFIGDSPSDMAASIQAGIRFVGFAPTERKRASLLRSCTPACG